MHSQHWTVSASLLAGLFTSTYAHSWPEALNLINSQGTIYGPTGYDRNFVPRNATGFKGDQTDSFQKTQSVPGAKVCMTRETAQTQSPGYPRLSVSPNDRVALRYAENGHVTIEQPGRPPHGGPVYIFGTEDGTVNPLITDVMQWNAEGTGGNKGGRLLATQNFDDGRCYENNNSPEAQKRKAAAPIGSQLALPDFSGLPCQNDFSIPADVTTGQPYTLFWVWNFTFPAQFGGTEIFSNCIDLNVEAPESSNKAANVAVQDFNSQQPAISAVVQSYFVEMASSTPAGGAAAQSGQPAGQSPASSPVPSPSPVAPAQPSAASPGQSSSPTLASEGTEGQVHGPAATSPAAAAGSGSPGVAAATKVTIETVYVTVLPTGLTLPPDLLPGASPTVSPTHSRHHKSKHHSSAGVASTPGGAQPPIATPLAVPPQPSPAAQSPQAAAPQAVPASPQSANGLPIPLLNIGASGVSRVTATPAAAPAADSTPHQHQPQQQHQQAANAGSESSSSPAPMPTGEECKKKRRAYRRSRIHVGGR